MGTVMNGNIWAGACVNGKVVSGLVKNGIVFYRKPISVYKRRIVVGDNLSGKTIYQDFPKNYYINNTSEWEQVSYPIIIDARLNFGIRTNTLSTTPEAYVVVFETREQGSSYLYKYDGSKEEFNNILNLGSSVSSTVRSISDGITYRHLFIEDENIRPLQVGDVITENTKFYFTFPDDFHVDIQSMTDENRDKNFIELDDGSDYVLAYVVDEYRVDFFTNNFSAQDYGTCYAYDRNTGIRINLSSKLAKDITDPWGNPFTGTVTMVDKNNEAYQHILVDTTTLGA